MNLVRKDDPLDEEAGEFLHKLSTLCRESGYYLQYSSFCHMQLMKIGGNEQLHFIEWDTEQGFYSAEPVNG